MSDPASALAGALRSERVRIVASLISLTGDWDLAEDCVQDAAERALATWPRDGVPDNPAAWLTTAARRRAIDILRRRTRESAALRALIRDSELDVPGFDAGGGYADDRLRLLFACCHPDLSMQDRVALTLKTVCGLSTRELARLFLVGEGAMSQRLLRTRKQIARDALAFEVPPSDQIEDRVDAVLAVIYLVFTEGFASTEGPGLRDELADEALTLAQLAAWLLPHHAETHALRALLLLQHSRRPGRTSLAGELIPLDEQDRTLWDRPMIVAGLEALRQARAATVEAVVGPYRVQAEIAALHSTASSPAEPDWAAVARWYDVLFDATASPVVELNRLVALGMRDGPEAGLAALDEAGPGCRDHPNASAVRADLLRRAGRNGEAASAYRVALEGARTVGVRRYLARRLSEAEEAACSSGESADL